MLCFIMLCFITLFYVILYYVMECEKSLISSLENSGIRLKYYALKHISQLLSLLLILFPSSFFPFFLFSFFPFLLFFFISLFFFSLFLFSFFLTPFILLLFFFHLFLRLGGTYSTRAYRPTLNSYRYVRTNNTFILFSLHIFTFMKMLCF